MSSVITIMFNYETIIVDTITIMFNYETIIVDTISLKVITMFRI